MVHYVCMFRCVFGLETLWFALFSMLIVNAFDLSTWNLVIWFSNHNAINMIKIIKKILIRPEYEAMCNFMTSSCSLHVCMEQKIQSLPYDFKSMESCFFRENYVLIDRYLYYSMRLDQSGWFGDLIIQFWLKILDFDSM